MRKTGPSKRTLANVLLIINTLCWGATAVLIKPALNISTPYRFLLYRYVVASVISLPFLAYYLFLRKPKIKQIWRKISIVTVLELWGTVIAILLLYQGMQDSTTVQTGIISAAVPVFVVAGGAIFLHEKEEKHEWIGTLISLIGVLLITVITFQQDFVTNAFNISFGNFLVVIYDVVSARYFVLIKKYYQHIPPFFAAILSFYVGAVGFFVISWQQEQFSFAQLAQVAQADLHSPAVLFGAICIGIFASVIGLTTYIWAQELIEASEAIIFSYLQPLIYIPLSVLLLGEKFFPYQALALALIFLGVFITEKRFKKSR